MAIYADTAVEQFENANELREYPFADGSSLVAKSGRSLPLDTIVDVSMYVPCEYVGSAVASLSSVYLSGAMVSACFKSVYGGVTSAMSVTVSAKDFRPYIPYRMEPLAGSSDAGGSVTFGDIKFPGHPETYFLEGANIHPCCVFCAKPAGLRKITDPRSGESLSGDVRMAFSSHIKSSRNGNDFYLSLDSGSESELASECFKPTGLDACGATPIVSINGVRPDSDGNIVLWFH